MPSPSQRNSRAGWRWSRPPHTECHQPPSPQNRGAAHKTLIQTSHSKSPMPTSPPKPCNAPGCAALVTGRFCEDHQQLQSDPRRRYDKARKDDPILSRNKRIRSSARWQKVARMIRTAHPLCQDPLGIHAQKSETVSSAEVHHIKGLSEAPELAFVHSNLMALCSACHAKIENQIGGRD